MDQPALRFPRRYYVAGLVGVVLFLGLIRFVVFPLLRVEGVLADVVDSLLGAALTAGVIAFMLDWLFPNASAASVRVVERRELEPMVGRMCEGTHHWLVRARTAVKFRTRTLPRLAGQAGPGSSIAIRVQLMDPSDTRLRSDYKRLLRESDEWGPERVRHEIYATIVSLAAFQEKYSPRLDISVALSKSSWVMSIDVADDAAILADHNRGPGLRCDRGSPLYESLRAEFHAGFESSQRLSLPDDAPWLDELNQDNVRELLKSMRLDIADLTDDSLAAIASYARGRRR